VGTLLAAFGGARGRAWDYEHDRERGVDAVSLALNVQ
jgi:hypothetical protein